MANSEQAKTLKENAKKYSKMVKFGIIGLVGGCILSGALSMAGAVGIIIGLVVVAASTVVLIIGAVNGRKVNDALRLICEVCSESMAGAAYGFREVSRQRAGDTANYNVWVEISAECPHCQHKTTYQRAFTIGPGRNNIQYQVETFCENIYKH